MVRSLLIAVACAGMCAVTAQAQEIEYTTTCRIIDGEAVGFISITRPRSHSFSGEITFYIYNDDDQRIDEIPTVTSVTVTNPDLVEMDAVDVSGDAAACAVDVTKAIDDTERRTFITTCFIEDGIATGYVQLTDGPALRFSGRIRYLTYDEDGEYLDEHIDQASIVLVGRDRREVGSIEVDDHDIYCTLDLSEAL